jgi:hypothetical protein
MCCLPLDEAVWIPAFTGMAGRGRDFTRGKDSAIVLMQAALPYGKLGTGHLPDDDYCCRLTGDAA